MTDWRKIASDFQAVGNEAVLVGKKLGVCNCNACVKKREKELRQDVRDIFDCSKMSVPEPLALTWPSQIVRQIAADHNGSHLPRNIKRSALELKFLAEIALKNYDRAGKIPKNKITQCDCCGVLLNKTYANTVLLDGNPATYCKVCKSKLKKCEHCGEYKLSWNTQELKFRNYETRETYFKFVCQTCSENLLRCVVCGSHDTIASGNIVDTYIQGHGERRVCKVCMETMDRTCAGCGTQFVSMRRDDYCISCRIYNDPIVSYQTKPNPIFSIDEKRERIEATQLFTGIELEVEALSFQHDNKVALAKNAKAFWPSRFIYCKKDSSLRDGLEIITQPFSWMHFKSNKDNWENFFKLIQKCGYGAYKTAGMHAHLNKSAFTTWHLFKFCQFFYREECRNFLSSVSDRVDMLKNRHCKFTNISVTDTKFMAKSKDHPGFMDAHHYALSLAPRDSLEVRIFQSPDTVKEFYKNIEFIHAVHQYTRDVAPSDLWPSRFLQWLNKPENAPKFRNLINHILTSGRYSEKYVNLLK